MSPIKQNKGSVPIQVSEERGVRYLHFGSPWIQGAMRIARPWALELEYTRDLMMPLLLRAERGWPATVLQIGLGAASIAKFLHRHFPGARSTIIEIAPIVITAAREYFRLPDDPRRIAIEITDGFEFVSATRRRFDFIVVDGFDAKGRAGMLDTVSFYAACRARLGPHGMLAVNLLTRHKGAHASVERMGQAFEGRVLELPPSDAGNVAALAAVGPEIDASFAELRARAQALRRDTGLNLLPALARLEHAAGGVSGIVL